MSPFNKLKHEINIIPVLQALSDRNLSDYQESEGVCWQGPLPRPFETLQELRVLGQTCPHQQSLLSPPLEVNKKPSVQALREVLGA